MANLRGLAEPMLNPVRTEPSGWWVSSSNDDGEPPQTASPNLPIPRAPTLWNWQICRS